MSVKSLFTKLKMSIFLVAIIPTLIITLVVMVISQEALNLSVSRFSSDMQNLSNAALKVDLYLEKQSDGIVQLSKTRKFVEGSPEARKKLLWDSFSTSKAIKEIKVFNADREMVTDLLMPSLKNQEPLVLFSDDWLNSAFEGKTSRSEVFLLDDMPYVNVTVPIYSDDEESITGVISAYISLQEIFSTLNKISSKNSLAYVLDEHNKVIYTTGSNIAGFQEVALGSVTAGHLDGGYDIETRKGELFLISYLPIRDTGWKLIWVAPLQELNITSRQVLVNLVFVFGIAILLAILLSLYITRKISKPAQELAEATKTMSFDFPSFRKKITSRMKKGEDDEQGLSFDEMRFRIKDYIEESKFSYSQIRERLEKRMGELRTIYSVTETFVTIKEFIKLQNFIIDQIQRIFEARFCCLYLKDNSGHLICKALKTLNDDEEKPAFIPEYFPIEQEPYNEITNSMRAFIVQDVAMDSNLNERFKGQNLSAYGIFPLFTGGRLIGMVELGLTKDKDLSESSIALLTTLAKEASIAIENAQLYENMTRDKEKIESILGTISDGVLSIDHKGVITSFNKAAEEITGYMREDVIGKPCSTIFQGFHSETENKRIFCDQDGCILRRIKDLSQFPYASEHVIVTPKGKEKILEFSTSLEKDDVSNQVTYVSVFRDVSRIKELEQLRADFIDTISHELRTPLTSIKGYVSALLHPHATFSKEESLEFLGIINEESNRLNRMITDLLEASRLHQNTLIIKPQPFTINEYIRSLVAEKDKNKTGHEFVLNLDESPTLYGDPNQIQFVINHLVENAIKYSPDGGRIFLSIETSENDASIIIEDEGIGIPEDQKDKIFDMFHRIDNRSTRRIYGPGLGLFLSQKIMEAHGKKIWVESTLSGGSRFVFSLSKYVEEKFECEIKMDFENDEEKTEEVDISSLTDQEEE